MFPFAYTHIARHFLNLCKQVGASNRIQILEYQRPSWTFHGKGNIIHTYKIIKTCRITFSKYESGVSNTIKLCAILLLGMWYYPACSPNNPIATLIGSPNYGYRSVEKDLEAQLTIVTKNKNLQSALHIEQKRFLESSVSVTPETYLKPDRIVPRWVKLIVGTCRKFF